MFAYMPFCEGERMSESALDIPSLEKNKQSQLVTVEMLRGSANAALNRLSQEVAERDAAPAVNYSRMHHRHARTHTRAR